MGCQLDSHGPSIALGRHEGVLTMHKHHAFSSCGFIRPVLALALCAAPFAYSQTNQSSKFKSDNAVSHADTSFMKDAAQGGMAEVKLGTLAQQNAMSDRVKMFGKRMVDDHSKLNMQAQQVASQKNITLPTDVSSKQKSDYEMLSKKTGSDFDKAYISMMV